MLKRRTFKICPPAPNPHLIPRNYRPGHLVICVLRSESCLARNTPGCQLLVSWQRMASIWVPFHMFCLQLLCLYNYNTQVSTLVGSKPKNPTNTSSYLKGEQSMLHLHQERLFCPLGRRLSNDCSTHLCWRFIVWAKNALKMLEEDKISILFPDLVIVLLGASLPRETPV